MIPIRIDVGVPPRRDRLGRFVDYSGRCAIVPCRAKATTTYGARPACETCADANRAFIERVKQREGIALAVIP